MQTHPTPYPTINTLLDLLLTRMQAILGNKLIGLYIFGSLVTGDFDYDSSDIDLIAATPTELDEDDIERLKIMHHDIALNEKEWDNRLEVAYISVTALRKYQPHYRQPILSPGEPFHVTEADSAWIINRWVLREKGITIYGPPPQTLVDPIPQTELLHAVREFIQEWREWIENTEFMHRREYQAYAILTACRALYTCRQGKFVSKKQAAVWTEQELPEWSSLIQRALVWRNAWREEHIDHDATLPETLRFVYFVLSLCEEEFLKSR
jgi:predicted nucleotidyltransferase